MKLFNFCLIIFCLVSAPSFAQDSDNDSDSDKFNFLNTPDSVKVKKRFLVKEPVSLMGVSSYISEGNGFNLPNEIDFMEQRLLRSYQWGFGIIDFRLGLNGKNKVQKLGLLAGVRWNLNYYRFQNDFELVTGADTFEDAIIDADREIRKHRLLGNYLSIPLMLDFNANPASQLKGLKISVGYVHSILLKGSYKLKYEDDRKVIRKKDTFNLNPSLGKLEARVGYGPISFYFQYGLDGLFVKDKGPDLIPISFGLVSGG